MDNCQHLSICVFIPLKIKKCLRSRTTTRQMSVHHHRLRIAKLEEERKRRQREEQLYSVFSTYTQSEGSQAQRGDSTTVSSLSKYAINTSANNKTWVIDRMPKGRFRGTRRILELGSFLRLQDLPGYKRWRWAIIVNDGFAPQGGHTHAASSHEGSNPYTLLYTGCITGVTRQELIRLIIYRAA